MKQSDFLTAWRELKSSTLCLLKPIGNKVTILITVGICNSLGEGSQLVRKFLLAQEAQEISKNGPKIQLYLPTKA